MRSSVDVGERLARYLLDDDPERDIAGLRVVEVPARHRDRFPRHELFAVDVKDRNRQIGPFQDFARREPPLRPEEQRQQEETINGMDLRESRCGVAEGVLR